MNPLLQDFLISLLRKALTIGATYLVTTGWLDAGEADRYVSGFALLLVSLLWSLWDRYVARRLLVTALHTMPWTPEAQVADTARRFGPGLVRLLGRGEP
jgi:hypothetical protein